MKLGIAISIVLVVALIAGLVFGLRGVADLPTSATRPEKLAKAELPAGLPPLWEPADPQAVANERYDEAIQYALSIGDAKRASDQQSDKLISILISAMDAGTLNEPFLDGQIPMKLGTDPQFKNALELIPQIVLTRAEKLGEGGDKQRAIRASQAVFAMGQRAFEHSKRLLPRYNGLGMMFSAASLIHEMAEEGSQTEADAAAWAPPLQKLQSQWRQDKFKIVRDVKPHIGDLINIARHDKDETFRIEAVLALGSAQHAPGHRGNKRAIADAIAEAKNDPNPLIVEAASSAEKFTLEERRKLR